MHPACPEDLLTTLRERRNLGEECDDLPADAFPDAPKAVDRIKSAIKKGEKIAVFGDYDCDGITAALQMDRAIRSLGVIPTVRLPHRTLDGYGIQSKHIDEFHALGITLLCTVDTGSVAIEALNHARTLGIDVIVLDHHHITSPPPVYALIHPSHSSLTLPHPSAAGVVHLFLHALLGETWNDHWTDQVLAMIGTVADLMELRGMNRTIVKQGMAAIPHLPDGGLRTLIERVCERKSPTARDIAYRIAPRINAPGRMDDPWISYLALTGNVEALDKLEELNRLRQEEAEACTAHATSAMEGTDHSFVIVADEKFQRGTIGLVAGRLTESLNKPSMVATIEGDLCIASFRSIPGYHVTEALTSVEDLLLSYGGHAQAAGASFRHSDLPELTQRLRAHVAHYRGETVYVPSLTLDCPLHQHDITAHFIERLSVLEPYGYGNPEPLFLLSGVTIDALRTVGSDGAHISGAIGSIKLIAFRMGYLLEHFKHPIDLAVHLGIDRYSGSARPQVMVKDVRERLAI